MQKYNVILSDPPWTYDDKAHAGKRGVQYKYNVMPLDEIKALPMQDISAKDCALFLWCTAPKLREGLEVVSAWGFKYKTVAFTWVKRNKKAPSWFWGMGRWTRSNVEFCLLGTRGKPKRISASVHSVVDTPIEGHSKKPDIVRDKIVQLFGDLPRIELFARVKAPGWSALGFELDGKDIRDSLREIIGEV